MFKFKCVGDSTVFVAVKHGEGYWLVLWEGIEQAPAEYSENNVASYLETGIWKKEL